MEPAVLEVSVGDFHKSFPVDAREIVIGRTVSADVQVDDPRVSRVHAIIRHRGEVWQLEDQDSANGTFLDGEPVRVVEIYSPTMLSLADPDEGISILLTPEGSSSPVAVAGGDVDVVHIGRAPDNDVVLDDATVSRHHAEIARLPNGRWQLRDIGSGNGVVVDRRRVRSAVVNGPLRVEIGDHLLQLAPDGRGGVRVEVVARGRTVRVRPGVVRVDISTDAQDEEAITGREREVLALIAGGATDKQIADALYISIRTVRSHLDRIHEKTGLRRRADLTRLAFQLGIAPRRPE